MFNYIWPIGLVIISNVIYQICTKSVPEGMDPFASLTITYLVGAVVSYCFFVLLKGKLNIIPEYRLLNYAPILLGIVVVGLEVGYIYAFKVGWPVSMAQIVQASLLAVILIGVGRFLYQEPITINKVVGIIICLIGLGILNYH